MDLRKLRHATVLAQTGSFVRAAQELHITQPALSRSIQSLEEELDVKLFERGRQGAHITREGRLLVERAEQVRLTLGGLRHDLAMSKTGELGEVSLGFGPLAAGVFLADIVTRLVNLSPHLEIRSYVNNADLLHDALLAERIDFFVQSAGLIAPDPNIAIAPLGELPLSLFVRAGHPLATKKRVAVKDLSGYPLMSGTTPQFRRSVKPYLGDQMQPVNINVSCDDAVTLKLVALRSDAVLHTSFPVVATECRQGTMVELKLNFKLPFAAKLVIASLSGRQLSPSAALAVEMIHDLFRQVQIRAFGSISSGGSR